LTRGGDRWRIGWLRLSQWGNVTLSVTEATIPGNNGDALHYTVTFKNPSNQDDAFTIQATATLPSGVTGTTTFNLGSLAPHQTATKSFTATVNGGPLLDGTVLTTSVKFDFDDSTGTAQPSITRTASTTVRTCRRRSCSPEGRPQISTTR
jgi:uncharacterized repeat protein (TIGR01451 family)